MAERILIWGAGAVGGTVGAYLARAGHEITFVDTVPEHVARIRQKGLAITGSIDSFTVKAPARTPVELSGTWSRIFLAVKAHHTRVATEALRPHLGENGYVLSLQNGLCELEIERIVGRTRTMGAFINFGADWLEPGEIMFGNRGAVVVGEVTGEMTSRLTSLQELLRVFEPDVTVTNEIFSYLWGKLAYASLLYAQALGQASIADCLARPELMPLWRALGGEVIRVALAEGVVPRGFNGFDPKAFMPGAGEMQARESIDAMIAFNRPNAKTHSGIWRDLAVRRRRTEVDSQIAPVVQLGDRHDIECSTLRNLVNMIHEAEDGKLRLDDRNLLELLPA